MFDEIPVEFMNSGNEYSVGYIPSFISTSDTRSIADQLNERYAHGGGWSPYGKDKWKLDPKTFVLQYPEDPPLPPLAKMKLRDETLYVYDYGISAIVQPDGSFEVSRLD